MKVSTFFSIGILISFFLPWVDLTFFELSGYNIPIAFSKISNIYNFIGDNDKSGVYKISYLLYLIPLCAVFNIIKDISKQRGFFLINEFLFGIIGTLAFYLYITNLSEKITSVLSIGFYLTAIFSILGLVASLFNNNSQENQVIYVDTNSTIDNTSQADSINALQESKRKILEEIASNKSLFESSEISEFEYFQTKEKLSKRLDIIDYNLSSTTKQDIEQTQPNITQYQTYQNPHKAKTDVWKWVLVFIIMVCVAYIGVVKSDKIKSFFSSENKTPSDTTKIVKQEPIPIKKDIRSTKVVEKSNKAPTTKQFKEFLLLYTNKDKRGERIEFNELFSKATISIDEQGVGEKDKSREVNKYSFEQSYKKEIIQDFNFILEDANLNNWRLISDGYGYTISLTAGLTTFDFRVVVIDGKIFIENISKFYDT